VRTRPAGHEVGSMRGCHAQVRGLERMRCLVLVRQSFVRSDRTYGARRVWYDVLAVKALNVVSRH
jgi:hypothetical protein